jgi:hypothetical protein
MPASAAATAVVHFIGIVAFSTQLSPDHHLQALMPRIPARPPAATQALDIEPHVAFLAFPKDALVDKNVSLEAFPKESSMVWIRLDGARVSILPEGRRVKEQATTPSGLPSLRGFCPAMTKLSADFRERAFRGAAAVFDVPVGKTVACEARVNQKDIGRIDTELTIPNGGTIRIEIANPKKTILLRGDTIVYAAHLPKSFFNPSLHDHGTEPHYMAYFAMNAKGVCRPKRLFNPPRVADQCSSVMVMAHHDVVLQAHHDDPFTDVQCSNSQWP